MVRSASLPDLRRTQRKVPDDTVSCRSLPTVLNSIEPTYSEIPDHVAVAQRPLPALPHIYSEIPDDFVLQLRRQASLSAITGRQEVVKDDTVSCKSLPATLHPCEYAYCNISDDDDDNDEDGPISSYAVPADEISNARENTQTYRQASATASRRGRSTAGRHIVTYGLDRKTNTHRVTFYEDFPSTKEEKANVTSRNIFGDAASQGVRTYVNTTDASGDLSISQGVEPTSSTLAI
ncbi:PREDICTED: uncharacterized protein LOC109483286 [Branchiostoma belcheri]|uniref:Uncharacterized protein LOC109483286 n=1 Tax=Branchiostoma belcheri TaxID=7741 RepID=A0A6P5A6E8_BRABE|nr:PREDICTED: uncharacterized protein LOC109483286 [Branchiostoma belcheri]